MAAIVTIPLGGLVAAAVYYTVSSNISNQTSFIRSELHECTQALRANSTGPSSSFDLKPAPIVSETIYQQGHKEQPPLSELVKRRWNQTIQRAVIGLETTDWSALGSGIVAGSKELVERVSQGGLTQSGGNSAYFNTDSIVVQNNAGARVDENDVDHRGVLGHDQKVVDPNAELPTHRAQSPVESQDHRAESKRWV
ncbi:hypothetical protein NliqN6_5332 [Naganishia liquefaciens]|uniref:MICOS complex subunit MIC12 n=1 Tax=Naganishia liquefaciens TaxID=104408 RepID=A0A8H3YGJ5_9TREE|nr:hypothetical protein NliqN6_5332 [Naganishia liquefaciens]